jgi:excisionase family DNA binding protein
MRRQKVENAEGNRERKGLAKLEQVGAYLALTRGGVYKLIRRREFATVKIGRAVRVPWGEVEDFVARHTRGGMDHGQARPA